jgi:FkbM family methyltransferase
MIPAMVEDIKMIYGHIGNKESREIFADRLLYSLTGNMEYMRRVICRTTEGNEFSGRILKERQRKVIFGAGIWGCEIFDAYKDAEFACFVDNRVREAAEICRGIPVISFQQYLSEYKDALVVISSRLYYESIYQQLKENGILDENIVNAGRMIDDMSIRQYFDLPEWKRNGDGKQESFVDAGCFDGRTSLLFSEWCEGNYDHIWAFEPDEKNIGKCKTAFGGDARCEVIPMGLWDEDTELNFSAGSSGGSKVSEMGDEKIRVCRLDKKVKGKVTFIKMDIEGSELKALRGGIEIISRDKPKLAISIYHKPQDIWEIPAFICNINPEYRLYFGHYSIAAAETVLYAV